VLELNISIGYDSRGEHAGRLVYGNAFCAHGPLACLLTIENAVSSSRTSELPPAAEFFVGVSSSGSTSARLSSPKSTVQRHAQLSDLASEFTSRGRPAEYSKGRSDKRACLRTVEVAREGRNSSHIPPPQAGTLRCAGTRNGPLERQRASQRVASAEGIPLFEPADLFATRTATDKNLRFNFQPGIDFKLN
jgi:hypothetical protein